MTFEEKGNGTTIRLVETVYLYLIQIDFDSKVTEFFHNDLGLRNVGEFVWTESWSYDFSARRDLVNWRFRPRPCPRH